MARKVAICNAGILGECILHDEDEFPGFTDSDGALQNKDRPTRKKPTDDMTKPTSAVNMHAVRRRAPGPVAVICPSSSIG